MQPTGAHDAYNKGDKVTFEGKHYISLIDGNVYSPTAYPAGWQDELYESLLAANVWNPSVNPDGWKKITEEGT